MAKILVVGIAFGLESDLQIEKYEVAVVGERDKADVVNRARCSDDRARSRLAPIGENVSGPDNRGLAFQAETSTRRNGQALYLGLCRPHPFRRHRASR